MLKLIAAILFAQVLLAASLPEVETEGVKETTQYVPPNSAVGEINNMPKPDHPTGIIPTR